MKRTLFIMVIVNMITILTLNSCNKDDGLPEPNTNVTTPNPSITLNLTAYHWEFEANGISVNKFENVIPSGYANYSVKVYLITKDNDIQINPTIQYMNGWVGATITATDVIIFYGGSAPYLNIKIVIE